MGIVGGGGTGAGFQLFTQSNGSSGVYADEDARDDYFDANPSELARLDANEFLIIKLLDDGAGDVAYQQYVDPDWLDVTSVVQGEAGPAGATGNSFFFTSIADRDAFFNTPGNEALLELDLPVVVNVGDDTTSQFVWSGGTSPPSYDSTLWRLSAIEVSSGTLYLGVSGANISSGSEVMNFISAGGINHYFHGIQYSDSGSLQPSYWKLPALSQTPLADVSTSTLSDPQSFGTTSTIDIYVKEYTLIPATSGELRVETWLGTDETGPSLVDTYITVDPGDIGNQTVFAAPNNTLVLVGQDTYTKFSGVQLKGGLQTLPPFAGQTIPFVTLGGWIAEQFEFVTQFNDLFSLKSPAAGTAIIEFTNSSDVSKGIITYDESTDEFSIDSSNEIIRIGSNVFIHSGAADGRIDIEATTTAGTSELTLSDAGGGTGLMISYDDNTNSSEISGEVGPLTIQTTTDEEIRFELGGSTAKVTILNATSPDTNEIISFTTGGTNNGTARIYVGSRTPEGNVTANGGSLYIRDDGTSSDLYLKRSDGGNTEWVDFIHSASGVKGPASSTDDGMVIWDGTTGELLKSSSLITTNSNATATDIILKSPSVSGIPAYFLENSLGIPKGVFEYLESSGITRLLINSADFELDANQEIDIFTTSATGQINLAGTNLPDTFPLIQYLTGGANGTSCDTFYGTRDPNSNVTGSPGDLYYRSDNANSSIYIHEGTGATNTDWINLLSSSGGVTGPASSTDNGIPTFDGTTGKLLQDTPVTIESDSSNTVIYMESPSVTGKAEIILTDSVGDARTIFEYIESSGLSRILATDSDLDIVTNGDMIIQVQGSTKSLTIDGSNMPDTQELLSFDTGGSNGAVVDLYVGTRNPEGNITALDGALYFRKDGVASNIFRHESIGSSASGWVPLVGGDNGGSTDKSIPIWNGTDSDSLSNEPNARIQQIGGIFKLELEAPIANDTVRFELLDSSSVSASFWQFNDNTKLTLILAEAGDLEVGSQNNDAIVSVNSATSEIRLEGFILPDTQNLLTLSTGGANGADVDIYVGTRNPNENVTALDGALYLRKNGVDSNIYLQNDSASSSNWAKVMVDSDTNAFGGFGKYQNIIKYSEDFSNAVWTPAGSNVPVIVANNATAPNGELIADTITFPGPGSGYPRQNIAALVDTVTYNVSVWLRLVSGSGLVAPRLGTTSGTAWQATSTWQRFDQDIVYSISGMFLDLFVTSGNTPTVVEFWGVQVSSGAGVIEYAKTEAFALTTADYGLSVAGNLRTDFAEIVSEASGALNIFRIKTGTFGSYVVLSDSSDFDNITIECYEDGTQSNISLDALTKSEIRSSSAAFEIKCNSNSVDLKTGGNDTKPPITIEAEGTNGAKIQFFGSIRTPIGNVTGLSGDVFHMKAGVNSGSYESLEATSGTNWFKRALSPSDQINIYSGAQFDDLATAGVITITQDTTFVVKVPAGFSTTTRIEVTGGDLMLTSENYQSPGITYTGGGTFFTNHTPGSDIRVRGRLRFKGNGTGTFCSIRGLFGSGQANLDIADTTIQDWADMGTIQQGVFVSTNVSYVLYSAPFKIIQTAIKLNNNILAFGGLFLNITSERAGAESDTVEINGIVPLGLSGSLFRIDPFLADESRVSVSSIDTGDSAVNVFDVTGGITGLFTAIADSSLGIQAITSVADDGSGNAVFTTTTAPLVGQTVVTSGFVTNTNYNGTYFCFARTATTFELTDGVNQVLFGTTEVGALTADGVQVTSNGHGLSNGNTLRLDCDFTTEYDDGYIIYNVQTNTFDVDAVFGVTQAGTWDTTGLDQTAPVVAASENFGKPSSSVKVEISVSGNIATTIIPAAGAKVIMNATPWITETDERLKTDALGDAIYTGVTTAAAKLDGNVLLEPTSSTKLLSCQFVRQDSVRFGVTFTNGTNIMNDAGHSLVNGDNVTFNDSVGTLPALLRKDIIYFVVNSVAATTFQVSYTLGGSVVTFADDGSGVNSYAMADLHGSKPTNTIAANNPRTLVPQALEDLDTNDKTFIIISNEDDATNIVVTDAYYRVVE